MDECEKTHCDYRRAFDAFAFVFHTNCGILFENISNNKVRKDFQQQSEWMEKIDMKRKNNNRQHQQQQQRKWINESVWWWVKFIVNKNNLFRQRKKNKQIEDVKGQKKPSPMYLKCGTIILRTQFIRRVRKKRAHSHTHTHTHSQIL